MPQANERGPKRKKVSDDQQPEASQAKKQCILSSNSVPSTRLCNLLSQYVIEDMLSLSTVESPAFSQYVIEDMLSLSTVESPAFRKLIGGLCCTQVPNRKFSLCTWIDYMMK